jgi:hypothetical protein
MSSEPIQWLGLRQSGGDQAGLAVRVEFRRALALRSEIRRAGWFNYS